MPQEACFNEIFQPNTPVYATITDIFINTLHGVNKGFADSGRPLIPFVGAVNNANGTFSPDSVVNNQTFIASYVDFFNECRQASINFVQNVVGGSSIDSPYYKGYLYKKTFAEFSMYQRYLQIAGIIFNFWTTANPAWTPEQYNAALNGLVNSLIAQADKALYIPNGNYEFVAASAIAVDLFAWKAAVPAFRGFICLEIQQ